LIDGFEAKGEVDLLSAYATPIPVIVICELLGVPTVMADQFLRWSHDMVSMYMAKRDLAIEEAAVEATIAFSDYMRSLISERRRAPQGDLLSELVRTESEGQKLSEDELVTTAILILNAGHEATVHTIGNGVKALLELGITFPVREAIIEEIMRYDAPLHLFTRYALENIEFAGLKFRKGEQIGLLLGAANRDPARFPNPDKFHARRDPNPHVSFGAGIHFCIGAPLARLEMLIAFQTLFKRLPNLRLAKQPHYKNVFHFHGLEELIVTF
jgi:cytochrome P450